MTSIQGWDCTKPGINTLDEVLRALSDIQRLTEIWERIAKENAEAWIEPENERLKIRLELESHARSNWSDWIKALDRSHRAVNRAELSQVGIAKSDVLKPVGALSRLFPYSILGTSDGAHLLIGVHPLGAGNRGRSYFPTGAVNRARGAVDEIINVLAFVAPRFADPATPTEDSRFDWTKSQLYDAAGISPSTFDRIRKAAGIDPAKPGGAGQSRRYTKQELVRLINAAGVPEAFRNGPIIVSKWREMLPNQL